MQQYKNLFNDNSYHNTFSNIQRCLRLNDWDEIGDSTHLLTFEMIGLFSFQEWTLQKSIDFMWSFLSKLNIRPDYVTIHPDKYNEWKHLYDKYNIEIRYDPECIWSDGNTQGYCTEFYKDDVEIGNIVNTLNRSIDIGFGLERLIQVSGIELKRYTKLEVLENTYYQLKKDGFEIGHNNQGHFYKKIIIESIMNGSKIDDENFISIRKNIIKNYTMYIKRKDTPRYKDKDKHYWLSSTGINIDRLGEYKNIISK